MRTALSIGSLSLRRYLGIFSGLILLLMIDVDGPSSRASDREKLELVRLH